MASGTGQLFAVRAWKGSFLQISVTRFGEISALWQILTGLWKTVDSLFLIRQNVDLILANLLHYWANFHCCKWPNIEKYSNHLVTCAYERCERIFVDWCRPDSAKRRGMPIWWPLSRAEQRFLRKKELRKMGLIGSHFTGPNCFRELFSNLVLIKFGKLSRIRYDQCDQIGQFHAIWATFLKPSCTFIWPKLWGTLKDSISFIFLAKTALVIFRQLFIDVGRLLNPTIWSPWLPQPKKSLKFDEKKCK